MPYTIDKPEPGALPHFLRREERLEDAVLHVVRHARARVAHDERDAVGRDCVASRRRSPWRS